MKIKYMAQKTAIAALLHSLSVSAQFNPIQTVTLHHIDSNERVSWRTKLDTVLGGSLIVKYSPDSKLVVMASPFHNTITVHDPSTGKLIWERELGPKKLPQIDIDASPLSTMWDQAKTVLVDSVESFIERIRVVEFSPDSRSIFVAFRAADRSEGALILSALTGEMTAELLNPGKIEVATFSPTGNNLVSGASSGYREDGAKVWKVATGELLTVLDYANGQKEWIDYVSDVASITFNRTGTSFYINASHTLSTWDSTSFRLIHNTGHFDGKVITNGDKFITDHSRDNDTKRTLFKLLNSSFSHDGQRFMDASSDGAIKIWKSDGNLLVTIQAEDGLKSADFSTDGLRIVTQGKNYAQIWDTNTGSLIIDFGNLPTPILEASPKSTSALLSNDGTQVLLTSGTKAQIWVLPPAVFTSDSALATAKNSLSLRSLKTMLLSYLPYLHINKKPSLKEFAEKYPEAQRAWLINLLKDMSFLHKDVGAYLLALFPELADVFFQTAKSAQEDL